MDTFITDMNKDETEYYDSSLPLFVVPISSLPIAPFNQRVTNTPIQNGVPQLNQQQDQQFQFIPVVQQQVQVQMQLIPQQQQEIQQPKPIQIHQRNPQSDNAILYSNHRNYQAYQQCILLSLLNKYADITIKRERKRSNVTLPFFTISTVNFQNDDSFDLDSYVQKRCIEIKEFDLNHNINLKTATRRFKTNRITEVLHTLIDLLRINDEDIQTSLTRYKEGIKQSETMIGYQFNKNVKLNEYDIKKYGFMINIYLKNSLINDEIHFNKGELFNIFNSLIICGYGIDNNNDNNQEMRENHDANQ